MIDHKLDYSFVEKCSNRVFGKECRSYLMGIAMIWIVLFHIYNWNETAGRHSPWWISMFSEGWLGVDIFLFLSAYGLEASIEKNSILKFYRNRIKRLFPIYLLFLLILFLLFDRSCPLDRILLQSLYQVTGLSLFQYADFFSVGFCFDWFTPAIILIYLGFPLISYVVRTFEKHGLYAEIVLLVFVIVIGNWIHINKHIPLSLLSFRIPIILLGVMTYRHLEDNQVQRVLSLYLLASVLGFFCNEKSIMLSLLIPSLLVVYSFTSFAPPLKSFVNVVGKYSYEVYLGHIYIVAFFIPSGYLSNIFYLTIITIIGTLIISTFFAYFQKCFGWK